jgi:hypothetical protein
MQTFKANMRERERERERVEREKFGGIKFIKI